VGAADGIQVENPSSRNIALENNGNNSLMLSNTLNRQS